MKKYFIFSGVFIIAYVMIQVVSGMLLTLLYKPNIPWDEASTLSSQVEFGYSGWISPLIIAFIASGISFAALKLINKKAVY